MKKAILFLVLAAVLASCTTNYSSGDRTGYVNKFSQKGLIYKTYEGELNLGGFRNAQDSEGNPTVVANIFEFSLDAESKRDENIKALADSIRKAMELGVRVKLHYNQEFLTDWNNSRGGTSYYVDKVTILY